MLRINRRIAGRHSELGVRFCDRCAEVSTSEERARRQYQRNRDATHTALLLGR
jgi:hypothetical protein